MAKNTRKVASTRKPAEKPLGTPEASLEAKPIDDTPTNKAKEKRNVGKENSVKLPLVIRDPVHDLIRIDCPIAARLIQTEPFQRLRRIKQLGLASMVYPGAEHTRFNHSLGVYHLVQRAMDSIESNMNQPREALFDKNSRMIVGIAALLHDLGHGPFSHQFERFADAAFEMNEWERDAYDHEFWTQRIIMEDSNISEILDSSDVPGLRDEVVALLGEAYPVCYMKDLVSSQLDMDRLDYLIRDSHFSGCQYGKVDCEWILRSLLIAKKKGPGKGENKDPDVDVLAFGDLRGRNCIEQYLLGRHFMNLHVYYHKAIVSVETMVERILHRALSILKIEGGRLSKDRENSSYPVLKDYAQGQLCGVSDYLALDDTIVMSWIIDWARGGTDDEILQDLSARLIGRRQFVNYERALRDGGKEDEVARRFQITEDVYNEQGLNAKYYRLNEVERNSKAYKTKKDIHVLPEGEKYAISLSEYADRNKEKQSVIISGKQALDETVKYYLLPRECRDEIEQRLSDEERPQPMKGNVK